MHASEMQVLGVALILTGAAVIVAAQILLSRWLQKIRQEPQEELR